ncbi:recombinase zinc ribbon domain-containing protein [Wolbachia endosymbiont (group B) of Camptogramma bilineatum]|uniref:zinc ribbon domain-containing protein n=1 Tax=Wolbachia endosymbiont (group B) of Camptogramma bilineatum TaxID=2953991 RepID=UPI00222FA7BC|nr:zinc ribbon domain-containing protein [Wolbachia endosymbiont (group B) of Camptogramma bilineatum]
MQGLVVCKLCNYAYYGTSTARNKEGKKTNNQVYYRCIGTDSYRFGGNKMCNNKLIRTDTLDMAVWEEVKHLLKNPNRILEEYKRRLSELKKSPLDQKALCLKHKKIS